MRPPVLDLIDSSPSAVVLVGRRADILAGNALGYALWDLAQAEIDAVGTADAPNQAIRLFLDPSSRTLFSEWERQADDLASYLRLASAERPQDIELHLLIAELSSNSREFARIWHEHPVQDCMHAVRRYQHPVVGALELNEEILRLPDDPGQRLIISAASQGTPSAERLALLKAISAR